MRFRLLAGVPEAEAQRLLAVAQKRSPEAYLMVPLGGEGGLRLVRSRDGAEKRAVSSRSHDAAAHERAQGGPPSAIGAVWK